MGYTKEWYRKNAARLREEKRLRYKNDPDYRDAIKRRSALSAQRRRAAKKKAEKIKGAGNRKSQEDDSSEKE